MTVQVPDLAKFRECVDGISHHRDQLLIKTLYLTAARASEVACRACPCEIKKGLNAYGSELTWKVEDFKKKKVLALRLRTIHGKEDRHRIIAIPLDKEVEPWGLDLAQHIVKQQQLRFPITRQRIGQIVKRRLTLLDETVHPHSLRHWRLTHLVQHYGFDAYDLTVYAGWTFKTTFGHSGQLDTYLHLDWRKYFPKLLKKL